MIHNVLIEIPVCSPNRISIARKNLVMTVCTRCGKEIPEHRTYCPSCGSSLFETQASSEASTGTDSILPTRKKTNAFPFDLLYKEYTPDLEPLYERNYAARPTNLSNTPTQEAPPEKQEKATKAKTIDSSHPAESFTRRFFRANPKTLLFIEVVLSLFTGIFGVGWLLLGKKRTGTLLLVSSVLFYLPLLIISYGLAYFSFGLSLLCTGPLAIGAVLLNAFMLHKSIQIRRAFVR